MSTITFSIIKSRERLEKQWTNLAKRGFTSLRALRKLSAIIFISTLLFWAVYFLTPTDYFEELKGVIAFLLLNGWIILFLLAVFVFFRNRRNKKRLKKFLESISSDQISYDVEINDEYVKIMSEQGVIEFPWKMFYIYGTINDTIYVYNGAKAVDSLYWDRDEMGNDSYLALIDLLNQKKIKKHFK